VYNFPSEAAVLQLLPKLGSGLVWAGLHNRIGFLFKLRPTPIDYQGIPIVVSEKSDLYPLVSEKGWKQIDGDYYGDQTVIRPEHKKLIVLTMGKPTIILQIKDQDIMVRLAEALNFPHAERICEDAKLQLGFEIYSSSFFESSRKARFLTLVMVLEALTPDTNVSESVRDAVKALMAQVKEIRDSHNENDTNYYDYDSLLRRLDLLKKRSKRQSIRYLVTETLRFDPDIPDPDAVGREILEIYDLRSSLVHKGSTDDEAVKNAIKRLTDIVPRVLLVMFSQIAKGS
jgi:hypothetical protein